MTMDFEPIAPLLPNAKLRPYLFALILSGLVVYFFLPRFAAMEHAFLIISNLRIPFVALSIGAQLVSYLGSGYLLRTVVRLGAKQPTSVVNGALMTVGANSVHPRAESQARLHLSAWRRPRAALPIGVQRLLDS